MNDLTFARGTRWRPALWIAFGALLLAPLIAMQFTAEVNWTALDFVVAGLLFASLGIVIEIILHRVPRKRQLIAFALAGIVFFAIWVEMATGFI